MCVCVCEQMLVKAMQLVTGVRTALVIVIDNRSSPACTLPGNEYARAVHASTLNTQTIMQCDGHNS